MKHREMPETVRQALGEMKSELSRLYGDRLRGLYLYGSYARGDFTEDSDVDVLVVLEGEVNPYREIDRTGAIVSDICLKYDVLIATLPISDRSLRESKIPLFINIRREGTLL